MTNTINVKRLEDNKFEISETDSIVIDQEQAKAHKNGFLRSLRQTYFNKEQAAMSIKMADDNVIALKKKIAALNSILDLPDEDGIAEIMPQTVSVVEKEEPKSKKK